ncbi:hypothetical protein CEXT_270231 [Caerostris extrusa]|uniref:Uncharacterized protein n=1 Tax=Caerostris extrusa TaxID=172846 RepID=A0AAV4X913_CAEEX|nr:hypothetical protein CEXT_270231 [Caerostris extrusa]
MHKGITDSIIHCIYCFQKEEARLHRFEHLLRLLLSERGNLTAQIPASIEKGGTCSAQIRTSIEVTAFRKGGFEHLLRLLLSERRNLTAQIRASIEVTAFRKGNLTAQIRTSIEVTVFRKGT